MNRQHFLDLITPLADLVEKKHSDYDTGGVELEDYFPFGHESYVQMMHVKVMRLVALTNAKKAPEFEKIEDTVKDLINYSVFYLDFLHEELP
jgi:hypothetical protein